MTFSGPRGFTRAEKTLSAGQKAILFVILGITIYYLITDTFQVLLFLNAAAAVFYVTSMAYRSLLIDISLKKNRDIVVAPQELAPPKNGTWPN